MAVKQEKVRRFLLSCQEQEAELEGADGQEARTAVYEALLLECKDALQALKDDLMEDPEFRARQQQSEGKVSAQHFLHSHLLFLRQGITMARNRSGLLLLLASPAPGSC